MIDESAPISGHHMPQQSARAGADAPEHAWNAARNLIFPLLRPPDSAGVWIEELASISLADSQPNTEPLLRPGPAGLVIAYGMAASGFVILVNAEHVLSWGIGSEELHRAALDNLAGWSARSEWIEEQAGDRRLLSSSTGGGHDAARLLLPEARARIAELLAGTPSGTRILVGLPERDLLVAGALTPGDDEFVELFREFLAEQFAAAAEPIDGRLFELRSDELIPFGD